MMTKNKYWFVVLLLLFCLAHLDASAKTREELLQEESQNILEKSLKIADQFYTLEDGKEFEELTQVILESAETKESIKELILNTGRRFFLFTYPSDGFQVKGFMSFIPNASGNPLLIFLRGGNRMFGLMHPATDFTCIRDYTVIATAYRGGVSEGVDEYGGNEVNDVHHLMEYFPVLQQKLGLEFAPKHTFMLGGSRGGMEMFLSLSRSSSLQNQVTKAASLSGLLDMRECIADREDMRKMFIEDFGLIPGENEEEWIKLRDPLSNVSNLRKNLPILILQGTDDARVPLNEGYNMVKKLEENGNPVTYLEIPGGNHCLGNHPDRIEIIADWFES